MYSRIRNSRKAKMQAGPPGEDACGAGDQTAPSISKSRWLSLLISDFNSKGDFMMSCSCFDPRIALAERVHKSHLVPLRQKKSFHSDIFSSVPLLSLCFSTQIAVPLHLHLIKIFSCPIALIMNLQELGFPRRRPFSCKS